jgi:spore coat polysaccharide biosynthesis predicted glycosyltransferase SpsG/molybdopterin-guanine dinucleotide biosynthesis protein A
MPAPAPLLAIVPARGDSRGVPNKNLRSLGGRPLVAHTLEALAEAGVADRTIVSSEHEPMLRWALLHGYEVHERPAELAGAGVALSAVAAHLADELDWNGDVGVFPPSAPFRGADSIARAVAAFRAAPAAGSLASVVRERHPFWLDEHGDLARARSLPVDVAATGTEPARDEDEQSVRGRGVLRETGAIQLVRGSLLRSGRELRTSDHVLFATTPGAGLTIECNEDLVLARRRIERGTVVFRLRANARVGSGHIYHCLQLADELADQNLCFLLVDCDPFVATLIEEHGYPHRAETDLPADLDALASDGSPKLVVNDVLDTSEREILAQRAAGYRVVNVEDLGPGARLADWVVNALYPADESSGAHVSSGPAYATLRTEFMHLPAKVIRSRPRRVLISFGGTDPGRLGPRCARLLQGRLDGVEIRVVVGHSALDDDFPPGIDVARHVRSMAAEMLEADLVLTSAGRTVYEAAATGTPVAVLAQGARDATHAHLSYTSGVVFLGIGPLVDDAHVVGVVERLLADHALRTELSERLHDSIDDRGATRIGHRIRGLLRGLDT